MWTFGHLSAYNRESCQASRNLCIFGYTRMDDGAQVRKEVKGHLRGVVDNLAKRVSETSRHSGNSRGENPLAGKLLQGPTQRDQTPRRPESPPAAANAGKASNNRGMVVLLMVRSVKKSAVRDTTPPWVCRGRSANAATAQRAGVGRLPVAASGARQREDPRCTPTT